MRSDTVPKARRDWKRENFMTPMVFAFEMFVTPWIWEGGRCV
jgi:hypothetical protein